METLHFHRHLLPILLLTAKTFAEFVGKVTQDHQLLKLIYELTVAKDPTGIKR